ncbi:hypothetical protein ONZ45_g9461 [Pleurotus djamor]|nr:hypothetical protein ONZ45_g9461 [Pleurotus djamor]
MAAGRKVKSEKPKPKKEKTKEGQPEARKRGRPKKQLIDEDPIEDDEQPKAPLKGEDEDDPGDVDWGDKDLTWALLNAIESNPKIRQGLFPAPGANKSHSEGGGKRKTEWHWELADTIFADHPNYKEQWTKVLTGRPALQRAWALKIKNRLSSVVKIVRKHREEMGQTGEGIVREDDIDTTASNAFTNKWAEIKVTCPWYWTVKSFIMERPNLVPAGVGNNTSDFDTSLLGVQPGTEEATDAIATNTGLTATRNDNSDDDNDSTHDDAADDSSDEIDQLMSDADEPDLPSSLLDYKPDVPAEAESKYSTKRTSTKRKTSDLSQDNTVVPRKKTAARPGTSTRATKAQDPGKAKGVMEKFSDMAAREDETTRKALELKAKRSEGATKLALAKLQAKLDMKKASQEAKLRLMEKKMDQEHELRLAQLRFSRNSGAPQWPSPTSNLLAPDVPFGNDTFNFGSGTMSVGSASSHASSPGIFADYEDI